MRIWRMTSVVSAAPGGASTPGSAMMGPPGCASGAAGVSNRKRSRPGWSLGGTTCATAVTETLTIAKAVAMARTPANMTPDPAAPQLTDFPCYFTSEGKPEAIAGGPCQLSRFGNFSRCSNKVTLVLGWDLRALVVILTVRSVIPGRERSSRARPSSPFGFDGPCPARRSFSEGGESITTDRGYGFRARRTQPSLRRLRKLACAAAPRNDNQSNQAGSSMDQPLARVGLFRLVEREAEAQQRQAHLDRLLVGVLHRDFQLAAGSHRGDELVGHGHGDETSDIGAGLDRLTLGRAIVDLDRDRLDEVEPERERHHHRPGLAVGRGPHHQRDHQLPGLTVENLLHGAAVQRLAVAGAFDPPRRRRPIG